MNEESKKEKAGAYRWCRDMLEECNARSFLPRLLKDIHEAFGDVEWEEVRALEGLESEGIEEGRKAVTFSTVGEWKGDEIEIILSVVATADGDFDATTSLKLSTTRELRDYPRVGEQEELKQVGEFVTSSMWVYDADGAYPESPRFEDCISPTIIQAHMKKACEDMKKGISHYLDTRDVPLSVCKYTTRHFNMILV